MRSALVFLLPILVCAVPAAGIGQINEEDESAPVEITLHPAAEPRLALKYRLLPAMPDLIAGNAAVYYGKVTAEQNVLFSHSETWENIAKWNEAPLEELRRDEVSQKLRFSTVYHHLERASRCEYCDWQLPIGEEVYYWMILSEVPQTRQFARFLGAKARAEIAEGRFDEAIHTLEIGYALGRHTAEGETLINGLVGMAICNMMSRQVQELIQQPDAPNLYWALTRLPRPMIDLRRAVDTEMNAVYWSFPELRDAEHSTRDAEYWRQNLQQAWSKLAHYSSGPAPSSRPEVLTALCIKGYPMAKEALITQGMDPQRVEAMPVAQVVALYTMRTYEELCDDIFKWSYIPYWQADDGMEAADQRLRDSVDGGQEVLPIAAMLLPAVQASRIASVRTDRKIAVLRTLEALRIYGAAHEGRLPETLDDVTEVPVPFDPVTGQAFRYELCGETALLEGPLLPGSPLRLEIRFAEQP